LLQAAPAESYDDFDSVMKKLELSAASLAEVAAANDQNFLRRQTDGQQLLSHCLQYTTFFT